MKARCARIWSGLLLALVFACGAAWAQVPPEDDAPPAVAASQTREAAAALLQRELPADATERRQLLRAQHAAAQQLEDRPRQIALARRLVDESPEPAERGDWMRRYLFAEFSWGSSGQALQAVEPWLQDKSLALAQRVALALQQSYFAAQGDDRFVLLRLWSRADAMYQDLQRQPAGQQPAWARIQYLQTRSEIERWEGQQAANVATLREAVRLSRQLLHEARQQEGGRSEGPQTQLAYLWLDGNLGMLCYGLVRQGRAQEALEIAQENLAQWRSGQMPEGYGARWHYRWATALVAARRYEAALDAASQGEAMLERAGAQLRSHTRWLARSERVRALLGLRRFAEADALYGEALAAMAGDSLATGRARDLRLLALLAAKNGRIDEALGLAERQLKYRVRLYGASHPLSQESAGLRGLVRLQAGQVAAAMGDYETLFKALLDQRGAWLDLDERGLRGFVLGLAFEDYLDFIAHRLRQGEPVEPAWRDRALQLSERMLLSSTQRAMGDASARLLATQPALRALIEAEQRARVALQNRFAELNTQLGEEDRQRERLQSEDFKQLPKNQRQQEARRFAELREQIQRQQGGAVELRAQLEQARERLAAGFPDYADLLLPAAPDTAQLQQMLAADEALLVLRSLGDATLVWLVRHEGEPRLQLAASGAASLARQVSAIRQALDLSALRSVKQAPALPVVALQHLYDELLRPLEPALTGVHSLLVATDGPLASLPLGVLVTQPGSAQAPAWLLRRMAVSQLPSAAALQALRRHVPAAAPPLALVGFGDPLFRLDAMPAAPRASAARGLPATAGPRVRYDADWGLRYAEMPPLPETRAELQSLARSLGADPQRDLVLGAAATRRAVLAAPLLGHRVVAFATHGLMPGELPGVSRPALAMAADPDAAESPLLELDDVLTLRLDAQWVLLSACNTAAGEQGGAAMSGLVRGFFFAGARSVLATHWAVDSDSAAALSGRSFQVSADGPPASRAESLRQAQLAMMDGGLGQGRWRHPYFWAGYALFGDPQR